MSAIHYCRFDSPVGPLTVAASDAGLHAIEFPQNRHPQRRLGWVPKEHPVLGEEDIAAMEEAEVVSIGQVIGLVPRAGYGDVLRARLPGRHAQYQCWEKERIPARLHYGSHPRIPPIVCQMDEGWNALPRAMIERRNAEGRRDAGAHGYDPDLPSMRAVFLAHGPAFRRGLRLPVFDNVDVYPLLARLVGVQPQPGDGNPQTLLPALQAP